MKEVKSVQFQGTESSLTWLIIGSTGFVGSALVKRLQAAGQRVLTTSAPRLTCDPSLSAEQISAMAASHPSLAQLVDALRDIDCVVLAAGVATPDAPWTSHLLGANALLPGLVTCAAQIAKNRRFMHISSAAVQGRAKTLTETAAMQPFSAYSRSKAMGEKVVSLLAPAGGTEVVIVRATSVQGPQRTTTKKLRRVSRSRLASVAGDGRQPSAVSSVDSLGEFVLTVGAWPGKVPPVVLQPWEGFSAAQVLSAAGNKEPLRLPRWLCRLVTTTGYLVSRVLAGRMDGSIRRVEAMWFGQAVAAEWAINTDFASLGNLEEIFRDGDQT